MKSRVLLIFSSSELYQIQSTNEVPIRAYSFTLNGKKRTSSHSTQTLWQMLMMSDRLFTQVLVQRNIWRGGSSVVALVFWRTGWFTVKRALLYIDAGAALSKMSSATTHLIISIWFFSFLARTLCQPLRSSTSAVLMKPTGRFCRAVLYRLSFFPGRNRRCPAGATRKRTRVIQGPESLVRHQTDKQEKYIRKGIVILRIRNNNISAGISNDAGTV
jgi:hypothetical protein